MNESTLEYIYQKFKNEFKNEYDNNISVDLIDITKRELQNLDINYDVKEYRGKERLFLYDGKDYLFRYIKSFYPNNSKFGFKVANDKMLTEKFLKYADIKTTNSEIFKSNEKNKALKKVKNSKLSQVIKPINLMGGVGVHMNVNEINFDYAWQECLKIQKQKNIENPLVIVQNQIEGFEVRVNITEGKVFSATLRVPSHVKGDGVSSIEHLINQKNNERRKDEFFKTKLIKVNDNLEKLLNDKGKSFRSILKKDELCVLYPQSNIVHGGENYEITNLLTNKLLDQARKAVLAIPGIHTAGVDIIIEDFNDEEGSVIEVNKAPEFLMTYYPIYGESYNPLNAIFKSLYLESRINRNKLIYNEMDENSLEVIKERFNFLYDKQKMQEKGIEELLEENIKLRKQLEL